MRIEDIDGNRSVPGAADQILRTLDRFGLHWDGSVVYQSPRTKAYAEALDRLRSQGLIFPCACSRRDIATHGRPGPEGPIYPGTCRDGMAKQRQQYSERLRVGNVSINIEDRIQGRIAQELAVEVGDFVVRRADGMYAYQLAVVVDDAASGINSIVRGADLLRSTPRQVYLQRLLNLPLPRYAHVPLVIDRDGRKLSKTLASAPVDTANPLPTLLHAWHFLGQSPLPEASDSVDGFWQQALPNWCIAKVPSARSLALELA